MKNVLKWAGIVLGVVVLGAIMTYGIPLMFAVLLVKGMEYEWASMNDHAEATLSEIGLSAYTEYAPWNALTIAGSFTAFELPKYDNHVDNTNLYAGIMEYAAKSNEWCVGEKRSGPHWNPACPSSQTGMRAASHLQNMNSCTNASMKSPPSTLLLT